MIRKGRKVCAPALKGEDAYNAKLTEKQVQKIRFLNSYTKMKQREIAKKFNVSQSLIQKIIQGKTWRHSYEGKPQKKTGVLHPLTKLNQKQIRAIKILHTIKKYSIRKIAKKYKVSPGTISRQVIKPGDT